MKNLKLTLFLPLLLLLSCGKGGPVSHTFDSTQSIDYHEFSLAELGLKGVDDWEDWQ